MPDIRPQTPNSTTQAWRKGPDLTAKNEAPFGKLMTADTYAAAYVEDYGFEAVCALARQRRNLRFLEERRPETILEVGAGKILLAGLPGARALPFRTWAIVEPARQFAAAVREEVAGDRRFAVVEEYLEGLRGTLDAISPPGFDAVIVSGLVHETAMPEVLLATAMSHLKSGGRMLVSAPNAQSFHRLLAVESGLIASPYELSALDRQLGHVKVYDRASLEKLIMEAGLTDLSFDGYLFKPFTNAQMQNIVQATGPAVVEGLMALGVRFPEHAAEICVTGKKL